MSAMEEIEYWVYTKRAPCLYNYDNQVKRQLADAQRAAKPASSPSDVQEVVTPKKKTKRKLSLLGDDSASPEKQQNVYFETSQQKCTVLSSCKSDTLESEIDFNIKHSSVQGKPKRIKLQNNRNNRTTVHKKNKVVTSTPKAETPLRRSLRRAYRPHDYSAINYSFDMFHTTNNNKSTKPERKTPQRPKKEKNNVVRNADGDYEPKISIARDKVKKNGVLTRTMDDVSDMSGLTANYIRSTKVQVTRSSRNLRSKRTTPAGVSQHNLDQGDAMVYTDKSINTKPKAQGLNSSTESSHNIINFVTNRSNGRHARTNKSTSLLKFVDAQTPKHKLDNMFASKCKTDPNSFRPQMIQSRHLRGLRPTEVSTNHTQPAEHNVGDEGERRLRGRNCSDVNDRKENPESAVSRTRSGRRIGLAVSQAENSVVVINNSTEQISSGVTLNVAQQCTEGSTPRHRGKKPLPSLKRFTEQKSTDNSDMALRRVSNREHSGFAACFSDSDTEVEPVKTRKFFC